MPNKWLAIKTSCNIKLHQNPLGKSTNILRA
uniref:Uncharacterized protein n=1 Tax=Nelumbo nucifera TaxID=4432 RepID=A0A822XLA3_NELNU|nr:TPA_asm: hypothetical protein HUJ06_021956 [Nelumbo nucifera]